MNRHQASEQPITTRQIRAIKTAQRQRGIDDDTYHDMLNSMFSAGSCKELTLVQANRLLARINGRAGQPGKKKSRASRPIRKAAAKPKQPDTGSNVISLASPAQHQLIHDLAHEIDWRRPDGYKGWLLKSQGLTQVKTAWEASRVIRGLKGLKRYDKKEGNS